MEAAGFPFFYMGDLTIEEIVEKNISTRKVPNQYQRRIIQQHHGVIIFMDYDLMNKCSSYYFVCYFFSTVVWMLEKRKKYGLGSNCSGGLRYSNE